ncbi:trafficking protein particle complex subunit 12-like isoform X2 [Homarus americanus]|uniref:trafficking protein particle complex subunit 12-like isoform X2 n=1 Tax=Homarus americanus TaxID=6706 RepID=UPI001C441893|nr:trafficking protein particle complex subunit 12-like isoform X2 [Homarus americanus]
MSYHIDGQAESSSSCNYLNENSSSFFDQLSPAPPDASPVPSSQQSDMAAPINDVASPQAAPASLAVGHLSPYSPQANPLVSQQAAVSTPGNIAASQQETPVKSLNSTTYQESAAVTPSLHLASQQETPLAPQAYPSSQQTSHFASHSVLATPYNIPLTPQYKPSTEGSSFVPRTQTPEPPKNILFDQLPVPTQLTPIQSAMMMSMTTSMLVTNTSPNASMDVEATTVKFQQASLDSDADSNISPQTSLTNSGNTSMDSISISNPVSTTLSASLAPSHPKSPAPNPKPPANINPAQETLTDKSKQNESKLFKYFTTTKTSNPFESIGGQTPGGNSDSAMINPAYMSPTDSFNISNAIPSPDSFLTPATEQDVFTASLLSSDADRRHDAWIPAETTRQALVAMSTSPPGTYFPEKELLTMPGIAVKEDFGDPVKNLVRTYLGEEFASKRVVLTAASVTQDDRGLRQLIASGCYHAAVNLTTQLLTVYGQGEGRAGHPSKHTAHSIQLWFTRIALLIKLRRFSLAEVECQYFGDLDAPDLYFEFYPELYGGRKGSMVPFGFRLLVGELPQHLGKHTQALDRLNALLKNCNQIIENLNSGLSEDGSNLEMTPNMRDDSLKLWKTRRQRVIYSITNCAVSLKDFRLAGGLLERLIQEDPNSAAGLYSALGRLCLQLGDVAAAQVINNLGVCLMYTGRVSEAITLVEGAVFSQPERFLHEAVVLNLATMYELESSNAHQNKLKLLSLIAQHKGDSFNVAALKLQPQ